MALRRYWLKTYGKAAQQGDLALANYAARNAGRVQGLGASSHEILTNTRDAFRASTAEAHSAYVSLGAGIALSVGQIGWDYSHGLISRDQAAYQAMKYTSLIGAGVGANSGLAYLKQGALRGTLKGNMLVGSVVLVADTSWNVYEHGGLANALRQPDFYEQIGGSVSGLGLGVAATAYVGASTSAFGPWVAVPSGLVAGTIAGVTAYSGKGCERTYEKSLRSRR